MADTLRQPIRWIRENIFVTRAGIPHAIWQLDGQAYGFGTNEQKEKVRALHQDLLQALTGELAILGLVATSSPESILGKMLQGVNNPSEQWMEECQLTYEDLGEVPAGERLYFLVAPLSRFAPREMLAQFGRAFDVSFSEMMSLKVRPPSDELFETWKARASMIERNIPKPFAPSRVGVNGIRWITEHLVTRGAEETRSYTPSEVADSTDWINAASFLPEPLLDEGGLTDLEDVSGVSARSQLFKRRYVKVESFDSAASYQQAAIMGLTPQAGFVFPGAEFVNFAASIDRNIDFCLRLRITPAEKIKAKNRRAERTLKDQYQQRAGTADTITGGSNAELDKSARQLQEYTTELNASDREVETAASIIFSAHGSTAAECEDDMKSLRDLYTSDDWTLDVPLGGQEKLFWDAWPGTPISTVANEFQQITTGRNFAMGVPLTSDTLGMPDGFRLATNITTGRYSPVYMNLGSLAENDLSGSFGAVGELGSGKSVAQKTIASHSIDRGAQLVAVDHSDNQEWAALGRALTRANVIDFMDPSWSLDPLRIYKSPAQRVREALNLMTIMLGVDNTSDEGIVLNAELKKIQNNELELGSLRDLKNHLASGKAGVGDQQKAVAMRVAQLMDIFSDIEYGATFFDPELPPMDFTAQATVFCTHGMMLPSREELYMESARSQMSIDKKVGRAAYAYLASVGANIMYADDSQEVLFTVDEAHHMTGSPEGEETISTAIKTGRKHKGAVGLGSHSAEELGSPKLRGLIPQRLVFRTQDDELASQNLRWLDPSYDTPVYREIVTKQLSPMGSDNTVPMHRRGEALYRDHRKRIGKIKVLTPQSPNRQKTVLTSPPKVKEAS